MINSSKTLKLAINSLHNCLEQLMSILTKIDARIQRHHKKWFYTWRTQDFTKEIEELKLYKNILDKRFEILQQIKVVI